MGYGAAARLAAEHGAIWRQNTHLHKRIFDKKKVPEIFQKPVALLRAVEGYFDWCDKAPLMEARVEAYKGMWIHGEVAKMRAYTKQGCCAFIGVTTSRWDNWRTGDVDTGPEDSDLSQRRQAVVEDVQAILEWAETVIWEQTFTGAAAGLLSSNLIARNLKLSDRTETTGKDGGPIAHDLKIQEEAAQFTRALQALSQRQTL